MKSFTSFVVESRMTTHEEVTSVIAKYKQAGEIVKPEYEDLVKQARRIFETEGKVIRSTILKHFHSGDNSSELNDLYYSWPHDSFISLNKASKLLTKLKDPKYKDVVSPGMDFIKKWQPVADDLKGLKGKVVKVTQKRAEAKATAEKVMSKKRADSSALIKIFDSHMKEYIAMAEKRAKEFIDDRLKILKKHDWDLNKVAPQPNSRTMNSAEYKTAQAKRSLYLSITKSTTAFHRRGEPDIREANQAMIERYIEMSKKEAEEAYRNFMEKMIQKIGKPVVGAKMTGNIWTDAILTVTTDDGEEQVWHTQMIVNFSKYQKMFSQFPTRRKK